MKPITERANRCSYLVRKPSKTRQTLSVAALWRGRVCTTKAVLIINVIAVASVRIISAPLPTISLPF